MDRSINLLVKEIRADVIKDYLNGEDCVCFTSGNAGRFLKQKGVNVKIIERPKKWYKFKEIKNEFKIFDATSGHLPMPLMVEISNILKQKIKRPENGLQLATGSGETFLVLKLAYPDLVVMPIYGLDASTEYHKEAPLNGLVKMLENGNNKQ